jgi:DNA-binding MarR family transcriptional regulator
MVSAVTGGEVSAPATPDLVELLTATSRRVGRAVAAALAEDGATLEGYRVLRCLVAGPGRTMGQLVAALHLPGPTATRVVDGLVDAALVYRLPDPDDGRRVVVHPSTVGRARLARWEALVSAQEAAFTRQIGAERAAALRSALTDLGED